jgi:uncharacterized membrane protein YjjP (DUF1212 family)
MTRRGEGVTDREVCALSMQAGHILLENGAELFRVEDTIRRINEAYGIQSDDAFVLSNGIFLTAGSDEGKREEYFARVEHIPLSSSHLDRVAAVNQLSREIAEGHYTVPQAQQELERIKKMPEKKRLHQILASGLGSGAFCCLFGGTLRDDLAAFLVGIVLYLVLPLMQSMSKIVRNILCGGLVASCAVLLWRVGLGEHLNTMVSGAIIPLIPGLGFVIGIRDLSNADYISGVVRLLDTFLIIFSLALGVGVTISLLHHFTGGVLLS